MAYRRFFCSFSGEDYSIIRESTPTLINLFVAIGVFVLFIAVLSFVSLSLFFLNLFEVDVVAASLALFFAWMITNIYLLILYTLAKNSFSKRPGIGSILFPYLIKYGFIIFISVLIAKPLEAFVFSEELNHEIVAYKAEQLEKYSTLTRDYFDQESAQIRVLLQEQKEKQTVDISNPSLILKYEEILLKNEKKKKELVAKMDMLISKSSFYTQQINILCIKYPKSWLGTMLIMGIFLLPAVLKNLISSKNKFYSLKKDIETRIVVDEYVDFRRKYNEILQTAFGPDYSWVELYEDPPFNYTRKTENRTVLSEEDFIKSLYHD
jgi:hypothetical protein